MRLACILQSRAEDLPELCGPPERSPEPPHLPLLECVPDPELVTHRALGLGRIRWWKVFTLRELWRRQREASKRGFRQSWRRTFASESDTLRSPGAALVGRDGKILWLHRGEHPADLPEADDLLALAAEHGDPVRS